MFDESNTLDENAKNLTVAGSDATKMAQIDMVSILASKDIYDVIVQAFPCSVGKAASMKERELMKSDKENVSASIAASSSNLVYGEIIYETVAIVINKIKEIYGKPFQGSCGPQGVCQLDPHSPGQAGTGTFVDLGSGSGKIVMAAAVAYPFQFCVGIELLESLYSISLEMLSTYNTKGKPRLAAIRETETHCQFINGDFLKTKTYDWRDADVVFANSTCYDDALMDKITLLANGMRKGTFFITVSRRLISPEFVVLEYELMKTSWGEATIFIHQKITEKHSGRALANASKAVNEDNED